MVRSPQKPSVHPLSDACVFGGQACTFSSHPDWSLKTRPQPPSASLRDTQIHPAGQPQHQACNKQKLWQEYMFIRNRLCLGRGEGERGKRHLPLSQPSEDSGECDGSLGQQGFHLPSWPPGVGVTILPSPAEPGPPHRAVEGSLSHTPHTAHGLGQGSRLQGFLP